MNTVFPAFRCDEPTKRVTRDVEGRVASHRIRILVGDVRGEHVRTDEHQPDSRIGCTARSTKGFGGHQIAGMQMGDTHYGCGSARQPDRRAGVVPQPLTG